MIISFVYIFKDGIIMDDWNVFMMGREEDDLGENREMGPSSLARPSNLGGARVGPRNLGGAGAGPNKLGGVGPSGIGGVEPTKKRKKGRSGF
jgi:hypothetical protein